MIGRVVSHYEILAKLGEGGMGVLYKARDSRLDRLVALKLLRPDKVADPERRRRFVQEARAASALNHPHIVTVYDIGETDGVHFIAMEHIEGTTLAERIGRSGLPIPEALKHAAQIADALAQAHAKGIVHRDLKPANVMVTANGSTKVLDFGLAKLVETDVSEGETTEWNPLTQDGMIVGTAAYMSPEQAQGRRVDARSDIFSFGSVLYEMLTAKRAFAREGAVSTLAAILKEEPRPPSELVPALPRELEGLIQACLRKDPARRFQHMDDVRTLLEQLRENSAAEGRSAAVASYRSPLFWAATAGLTIAALAALVLGVEAWRRPTAPKAELASVATPFTTSPGFEVQPSFSPDGNEIAFAWNGEKEDNYDIYRKLIGPGEALRLTRDPAWDYSPAWSPDGRLIAFLRQPDEGAPGLYLIPALGGAERRLVDIAAIPGWNTGIAWTADNKRLIVSDDPPGEPAGLFLLSLESGEKKRLTSISPRTPGVPSAVRSGDWDPALSADERRLAFTRVIDNGKGDVHMLRLGPDMTPEGSPERLTFEDRYAASPTWLSSAKEILYSQGAPEGERQVLRRAAVPSDPDAVPGRPVSLGTDATNLAFSRASGRLVFSRAQSDSNIYRLGLRGPGEAAGEPERLIASTRLDSNPEYSPKEDSVAFMSSRSGSTEIWLANADGSNPRQLTSVGGPLTANPRWSPDGAEVLFDSRLKGSADLYVVSAEGGSPRPLTDQPSLENEASWSRDGRSIYFGSDRTGRREVWRMPASGGEATQMTHDGGSCPLESPDSRWLYYAKRPRFDLWKAPVAGGAETRVLESLSYCFNYVPTSRGIYFVGAGLTGDGPAATALAYLDLAAGKTKLLLPVRAWVYGLTLSPDGRSLLYSRSDASGADLILVDTFR
jgi:Tol biopolymer transport system component/predicted Ser/Thr protein kinase